MTTLDWSILALYLVGMLVIGWFFSKRSQTSEDYLLGGRSMNPFAVGLSLFATLLSSISYLSYPGEMIKHGPIIFSGMLAWPLVYYIVGWHLIPKFMSYNVTSAYEILEIELGVSVRMLATLFFLFLRFLWMATLIYATVNIAILPVLQISKAYYPLIAGIIALITIIYTSMGGIRAVVTTDVIQSLILLCGAILTIVMVSNYFGSVGEWLPNTWPDSWAKLSYGFHLNDRMAIGNAVLYALVWYVCTAGSDQVAIQRYLSTDSVKSARKTFGISLVFNFIVQTLLAFVGLSLFSFFLKNPNYLYGTEKLYNNADTLFTKFILEGLPIGVSGLVLAGLIAAAMSSFSSGLNSSASVIYEDLILRFRKKNDSSLDQLKQLQIISVLLGIVVIGGSFFISYVEGNLLDVVIKVANLFVAPLFVLFFLTLFIRGTTVIGAVVGGIFSVFVAAAIAFFQIFNLTVLWIMPIALFCGVIIGIIASYLDKKSG